MASKIFPHVTEKSVALAKAGKYTFVVPSKMSISSIGQTVRLLYSVHPTHVARLKIAPKAKGFGRTLRKRAGLVKAVVTVKKGEKIPEFITEEKK